MKSGQSKIKISLQLHAALSTSDEFMLRRLPTAIDDINMIAKSLPDPYHWHFKTADAFHAEVAELASLKRTNDIKDLNALYWRDTIANIEAYTVTAVWRMIDICQAAFRSLDEDNIVPASILARSAFESAIQFVNDARTISSTLDDACKTDLYNHLVTSKELEHFLLKTVFSSRSAGSEEIYKSTNILTVIDKIAKLAKDDSIKTQYELLCELTHPNFLGRSVYLVGREKGVREGDEVRIVSHENGVNSEAILELALWTLCWAIEAQGKSFHLIRQSISEIFKAFPVLDTHKTARH